MITINIQLLLSIGSFLALLITVITFFLKLSYRVESCDKQIKFLETTTIIGLNDQIQTNYKTQQDTLARLNEMIIKLDKEFDLLNLKYQYRKD